MPTPRWLRKDRLKKRLTDIGLASGLVAGHTDYNRFIVLGRGRSGSNFLATSLETHPNIVAFGEVFNNLAREKGTVHFRYEGYDGQDPAMVKLRDEQPVEFIDTALYSTMPKNIQAVGFKLFYYHAKDSDWQAIWPHLQQLGVRAIHIQRRNLLESLVSEEIAQTTKAWSSKGTPKVPSPKQIELPVETCRTYFEAIDKLRSSHADMFESTLDLYYEDLVQDYAGELERVQDFLGVPQHNVTSPLRKQAKRPVAEVVSNFAELEKEFTGTPWAWFFEPHSQ